MQLTAFYVINEKANDTLTDQEIICYSGKDHIFDNFGRIGTAENGLFGITQFVYHSECGLTNQKTKT